MALTWLADVLRDAGLEVVEHTGWQLRMRSGSWDPRYGVVHATAAPRSQADQRQVAIVRDGRSDLPGPIANACVDRLGRWHVLSAGRCNSTLVGTAGPFKGLGNTNALSTEACNDNAAEPWTDLQYDAYVRGWAAWCRRLGWPPSRLVGHKEHTPGRKTDPTFDMDRFRADVARVIAAPQEADMALKDERLISVDMTALQGLDDVSTSLRLGHSGIGGPGDKHWINKVLEDIQDKVTHPPVIVVPTPEQMQDLAQVLLAAQEAATERAVRRVLGGLDGAVPPAGG